MTDEELVEGVRRQDPRCLSEWMARFHAPLVRFLWGISRDRDDAHDLASETLIRSIESIDQFKTGNLRAWVFQIGYRRWQHHRRAQLIRFRWVNQQEPSHAEAPNPDSVLILEALAALPIRQREAFVLVAGIGLSVEEAADVLNVPAGTVKSRCHSARHRLQELLAPSFSERYPHEESIA